ncbi:BrnT family toxin [Geminocystis herdmanii]|uniref:BrnT family toxin n=1 Tax=Geminocystis herdmanii TaxID=669359 RepID=UPI00034DD5AB|nr:BrnT family toxin [Geminocystis herdmanii]
MEDDNFEWDDEKDNKNQDKHSISFDEAREIFLSPIIEYVDNRQDYGEVRYIATGKNRENLFLTVVYTFRNGKIRIISTRFANKKEKKRYENSRQKDKNNE